MSQTVATISRADLSFTRLLPPAGRRVCELLAAAEAVRLGPLSSDALAALLAACTSRSLVDEVQQDVATPVQEEPCALQYQPGRGWGSGDDDVGVAGDALAAPGRDPGRPIGGAQA